MRKLITMAALAAMISAVPAMAEAQGKGKGHGARSHSGKSGHMVRKDMRTRADYRTTRTTRSADRNRNGIPDYRERRIDRDRDGIDDRRQNRYAGGACPPGLAKKSPACLPPGQAKQMFRQGQRIPTSYRSFTDYDDIPLEYRNQYNIPSGYNYIYRDNSVYVVDPRTRLVESIFNIIR